MTRLADLWRHIPRVVLYAVVGLVQLAALAWIVVDRAGILRNGAEVLLQTTPIDPRDWLRGDYVTLTYDISHVPAGDLANTPSQGKRTPVYVTLTRDPSGLYQAASVHAAPVVPGDGEVMIRGRVTYGAECGDRNRFFCPGNLTIAYGIENYFVPEGEGMDIEQARVRTADRVTVAAAVMPNGRAAIKRLMIDGKSVYDEPLY